MEESDEKSNPKWHHPSEVMKLHQLKMKKKALQARIQRNILNETTNNQDNKTKILEDILSAKKRKNPFAINKFDGNKRFRTIIDEVIQESSNDTLFKLFNQTKINCTLKNAPTTFENILQNNNKITKNIETNDCVNSKKDNGETWFPIDWSLKHKLRLWSKYPFPWNQKLKISEEASGVTSFVRCLDVNNTNKLDIAPNSKFHQCCLVWQHPYLPWISLFPRNITRKSSNNESSSSTLAVPNFSSSPTIKLSLQNAWSDSFRSLYQLIKTKQCPYFYLCCNTFTILFRAAGISGFDEIHAIMTPTTRGFRSLLQQEHITFSMPLKKCFPDQGFNKLENSNIKNEEMCNDNEKIVDEEPDEKWLKDMGIKDEDIKQIYLSQTKLDQKVESEIDNSEHSLILVKGIEVNGLYNFLLNCKSTTALTGPLAGVPPTLLAPVAFNGATLNSLKMRENKVNMDNCNFYSIELIGPILPSTIHNLFSLNKTDHSISVTFDSVPSTKPFSSIKSNDNSDRPNIIFGQENLSDCGLNQSVLKRFCMPDPKFIENIECLKYNSEKNNYIWN